MNDRMELETWEQQVEWRKVHQWGRDWNNDQIPAYKQESAEEIVLTC